jgi:hypothetical protein
MRKIIIIACVSFALLLGFSAERDALLQKIQKSFAAFSSSHIPKPSAILLFSMGFLGVMCVIINEKRKNGGN